MGFGILIALFPAMNGRAIVGGQITLKRPCTQPDLNFKKAKAEAKAAQKELI